jgi:tRNA1(Val) A37 N6-methylase TrmN6
MNNFVEDLTLKYYFDNVEKLPLSLGIERRDFGAYYTDQHIVNYILDNLSINEESYILDPSCGCGSFLFPLYLRSLIGTSGNLSQIYGVDIDKKAIDFTVNILSKLSGHHDKDILLNHLINDDFIFESKKFKEESAPFTNVLASGGFHFIIGNPPFNITIKKRKLPTLENKIHIDIAQKSKYIPIYFILRALELLRNDGTLAFVLPKTLLYVGKYNEFRTYLLENFTIQKIVEIGIKFKDVRGEQIILFIKNKKPVANDSLEFSTISNKPPYRSENAFKVMRGYFTSRKVLPTMPNKESYQIINELSENHQRMIEASEINVFRGVSLGKSIINRIPYNRNSKIPSNAFIRGKSISKLSLKELVTVDDSQVSRSKILELCKPKIVTQNIYSSESGLISYLDMQGIPTTETVSNIIIDDLGKLAYVFALLNSKLMNFYLSQFVFSGSKLTMHVDKYYLLQLPLIWYPDKEETLELIKLVNGTDGSKTKNYKTQLKKIDELVYKLYKITDEQRKEIETIMNRTLSKKSIW